MIIAPFGFTTCIWHELHHKRWFFEDIETIIQHIELSDYTDSPKIKEVFFTVQSNPSPVDKIFDYPNTLKSGIIFLYAKIDYQTFLEADQKQALALLCQTYLDAILNIPTLKGMKKIHFETQKLHKDLKQLFSEKGFLGETKNSMKKQ